MWIVGLWRGAAARGVAGGELVGLGCVLGCVGVPGIGILCVRVTVSAPFTQAGRGTCPFGRTAGLQGRQQFAAVP